jgi:hypothetical protein
MMMLCPGAGDYRGAPVKVGSRPPPGAGATGEEDADGARNIARAEDVTDADDALSSLGTLAWRYAASAMEPTPMTTGNAISI